MNTAPVQKCPEHPDWNVSGACSRCGRFTCVVCVDLAPAYAKQECSACLERRTAVLERSKPTEHLMFFVLMGLASFAAISAARDAMAEQPSADLAVAVVNGGALVAAAAAMVLAAMKRPVARFIAVGALVALCAAAMTDDGTVRALEAVIAVLLCGVPALWLIFSKRLPEAITYQPPPRSSA